MAVVSQARLHYSTWMITEQNTITMENINFSDVAGIGVRASSIELYHRDICRFLIAGHFDDLFMMFLLYQCGGFSL